MILARLKAYAMDAALAVAVTAAAVQTWRLDAFHDAVQREKQTRQELARLGERAAVATTTRVDHAHQMRREAARPIDAAARAAADRVRDDTAARAAGIPDTARCPALAAERERLAGLVERAADLVARCQRVGQQLADEVTSLQDLAQPNITAVTP